ncbi:MAG: 6-phosphogluconolactonase [Fimbriimonadales bacterium]|nr:MAG: 6-phosphogluconolactonase [Fimbriimonadales bacterium]
MDAQELEQQLQQILQKLANQPDAKVLLRLYLMYGQYTSRGAVLLLDWGRVADALTDYLRARLQIQPTCSLLLSGGKTPETLYLLLSARHYQNALDWTRVHLFWGDERYVPHDDPRSNYHLAHETWLRKAKIPTENIHPMPTHYADPEEAARAYEDELRRYFGHQTTLPQFDLILLGLGDDGHIASLFPNEPALEETTRWVVPSTAPVEPRQRLTLTLPVLNASPRIWFLVSGEQKRPAIEQIFLSEASDLPAARISSARERFWWLSQELYAIVSAEQMAD